MGYAYRRRPAEIEQKQSYGKRGSKVIRLFMFSLSFLWVASILAAPLSFAQDRLTFGLTTRAGSTSLPFVIAEEKGFFKSEGLNVIVVIMQNQVVVNGV